MPDLEISRLPGLAGSGLQATDPLPLTDLSASETKKITAKELIQFGVALIDPGSIPADKINYTPPPGSIGTVELVNGSVTAIKMADGSSGIVQAGPLPSGAFIGQIGVNLTDDLFYVWDGGAWHPIKASGSVNDVTGNATGLVNTTVVIAAGVATVSATLADTTAGREFLAGPTGAGGAVSARKIIGDDLPDATATAKGAVSVPGNGLKVTSGALAIDNIVTPNSSVTMHIVEYDAHGLVVGGRSIQGADLPVATSSTAGAIKVGSGLQVDSDNKLNHSNSVAAGTGAKLAFDAQGHITGATNLLPADIPALDAAQITSGVLSPTLFGPRSITQQMMGDYAFAYIQELVPPTGAGAHPIGMIWLQESTGQVSVWNGNSWMKTGASTLFNRNLRYGGSYNAATGAVTGVTQFGTAEGFKVGDTIPAADDKIAGLYFVASTGGSSSSLAGGAVFDPGDWLLCQGTTGGWARIDTLSGGGGGSTVSILDDLLDVTLTAPATDDLLQLNNRGQWVNIGTIDGGSF